MRYTSIRPGQIWLDTNGRPIHAHGGSMLCVKDTFYWYGENKEASAPGTGIWHNGVCLYSSKDLYNWTDEGLICLASEDEESPLHPKRIMDRPHILYNDRTRQFVMWLKFAGSKENPQEWQKQYMGIAVSDDITGPFTLIDSFHPLGMNSGDFDLVKNESDGKAYIYFERVHSELICADLTDDYTGVTGYYSTHFSGRRPPFVREAPAFFKRKDMLYLITSGTTAYFPNPSEIACSPAHHGPWTALGDPHEGDGSKSSFRSQISSVFKHPGKKNLYIALADRWLMDLPEELPDMMQAFDIMFNKKGSPHEDVYALTKHDISTAGYVWLPIEFENNTPVIRWYDSWKTEDFE